MQQVSRYHPVLATLHWLLAAMIIGTLPFAFFVVAPMPNSDPHKILLLMVHMAGGMGILALMVIRFFVRIGTVKPPKARSGHPVLDRLAVAVHHSFYVVVLLMASSGIATALSAGLNRSVFQGSGEPLPASFTVYPSFLAHAVLALILTLLIVLHVSGAAYHQLFLKDGLIRRMSFGARTRDS